MTTAARKKSVPRPARWRPSFFRSLSFQAAARARPSMRPRWGQ